MNPFKYSRVFIVGQPGAGKGLLGKMLAERLGWQLVNIDYQLEFRIGKLIKTILGEAGEKQFHHTQNEILATLLKQEKTIVVTDGSIVSDHKSRQMLTAECVVHLQASVSVQMTRITRQPEPVLLNKDLKAFLETLHQERDVYNEEVASITIDSDNSDIEDHISQVIRFLKIENSSAQKDKKVLLTKKDLVFFHQTRHVPVSLSQQQAICLKLLAEGKTAKEIAIEMKISYRTVEEYLSTVMDLLGCESSKALIALYHQQS